MYAELGGVESTFTFDYRVDSNTLTIANHMGAATRKWRVFRCDDGVGDEVSNFRLKLRSSIIHNIQKLKRSRQRFRFGVDTVDS
uniref:Uncharacterized protein n=1 Tax=Spodoptera frugiperda ascovirus 1a TaxID=113370 RepID=Q9DKM8_SFAVA|nr:hypothetical protein [Spodoptera frugiperda ascovirus 1a]